MEFLEEYQRYPCLWDKGLAEYSNRLKRNHAESQLLQITSIGNIKEF